MKLWEKVMILLGVAHLLWLIWETGRCPLCGQGNEHTHSTWEVDRAGLTGHPGFRPCLEAKCDHD